MSVTAPNRFSDFPSSFKGPVVRPGDADFATVKHLWNSRGDEQVPALIARATSPDDVVVAVQYAVSQDVSVAVRGGGHGIECRAMAHDALVVDMSLMKNVTVDAASGRCVVEAGTLLGEMTQETETYGWVVPAGTVSTVGVSGLTLGGGHGHLTRRFGAACDNVVSIDVVTMDGRKLTASEEENADLFWGLRGAGQNLAIATSFTFQGVRLESVITREQFFGPDDARAVLENLDRVMERSPRELSITPLVQRAEPMPGVPEEIVGLPVIAATVTYTGPADQFESAMSAARELLPAPMAETQGPSTWVEVTSVIDDWMPAGRRWYNGGGYLAALTPEVAQIALEVTAAAPDGAEVHFPVMGGAILDPAEDATALSRVDGNWMYEITAQWDDPADDAAYMGWVDTLQRRLDEHTLPNGCINLNPDRGPAGLKALFGPPEKWERLLAIKQKWDPDNRLRHNKNIRPIGAEEIR